MLKIRRPLGRLIFNMGIATPGKTVFLIETAPRWQAIIWTNAALLTDAYICICCTRGVRFKDFQSTFGDRSDAINQNGFRDLAICCGTSIVNVNTCNVILTISLPIEQRQWLCKWTHSENWCQMHTFMNIFAQQFFNTHQNMAKETNTVSLRNIL